jgi:hypothetical protein
MRYMVLPIVVVFFIQLLISCNDEKKNYGSEFRTVKHLFKATSLFEKNDFFYWEDIPLSNPRSVGPTDSRMIIVIKPEAASVSYLKKNLKGNCLSFVDTSYIREWMPNSILKIFRGQDSCCYINTAEILYNTHKSSAILTKDDYLMFIVD